MLPATQIRPSGEEMSAALASLGDFVVRVSERAGRLAGDARWRKFLADSLSWALLVAVTGYCRRSKDNDSLLDSGRMMRMKMRWKCEPPGIWETVLVRYRGVQLVIVMCTDLSTLDSSLICERRPEDGFTSTRKIATYLIHLHTDPSTH